MHERTIVKERMAAIPKRRGGGEENNLQFSFGQMVIGELGVKCRGGEERVAARSDSSLIRSDVSSVISSLCTKRPV